MRPSHSAVMPTPKLMLVRASCVRRAAGPAMHHVSASAPTHTCRCSRPTAIEPGLPAHASAHSPAPNSSPSQMLSWRERNGLFSVCFRDSHHTSPSQAVAYSSYSLSGVTPPTTPHRHLLALPHRHWRQLAREPQGQERKAEHVPRLQNPHRGSCRKLHRRRDPKLYRPPHHDLCAASRCCAQPPQSLGGGSRRSMA